MLSVIMPVYNEASTLDAIIEKVMQVPIDKELVIVNDGSSDNTADVLEKSFLRFNEDINLVTKSLEDIIVSRQHLGGQEYSSLISELWSLLDSIKEREQTIGNQINESVINAQKVLMANSAASLRNSEASLYLSDSTQVTLGTHGILTEIADRSNLPPVETVLSHVPYMSSSSGSQYGLFDPRKRNAMLGAADLLKSTDFMSRSTELILEDILKKK